MLKIKSQISSMKISFDWATMKFRGISAHQLQIWAKLYPNVDTGTAFMQMVQWLDKQVISREPLKISAKGRKRNWKAFIVKWLQRNQIKAVGL